MGSPSDPPDASSDPAEVNTGDEEGHHQFEIVDAESSEGVEGADVAVENGETVLTGTTDGAGVTTIREIPYEEYELTVEHGLYANHSETVTIDEARAEMTLELEAFGRSAATIQTVATGTTGANTASVYGRSERADLPVVDLDWGSRTVAFSCPYSDC